ncbi:MAG: hypothetical protein K6E15_11515 [Prevotella sp.]|nr:hypothetical protein [Prevotella sp.]
MNATLYQHEWMEHALYINPDQIAKDMFGDWNFSMAMILNAIINDVSNAEIKRLFCSNDFSSP